MIMESLSNIKVRICQNGQTMESFLKMMQGLIIWSVLPIYIIMGIII